MKKIMLFCCCFLCVGCTLQVRHTITGTILEASMNTMTIETEKETYTFTTTDAKKESIHGFLLGETVTITYEGNYQSGIAALTIKEESNEESSKENPIPTNWLDDGVFRSFYSAAYQKLKNLTLEEKIGQLILARLPETQVEQAIQDYHLGGFVLFGRDFQEKTKEEVKTMLASYQAVSNIPLLLATDEEGGSVVRVSRNPNLRSTPFPSPQQVLKTGGVNALIQDTEEKADLLRNLGLNLNLAPVADVSTNPNDFIYNRSLGKSAQETATYIQDIAVTYHNKRFGFTLKHFPGYGNNQDTHTGIAIDSRPLQQFEQEDFLPFEAGIKVGAPSILVSHNIVRAMDPQVPASLSLAVHQKLRNDLHFTGVIMTDDLAMGAITEYTNGQNPAVKAFLAGNDLLLTTDYMGTYQALQEAIQTNMIPMEQVNHSVFRILSWKYQLGLLD